MDWTVTSAKICQGTNDYERDDGMQAGTLPPACSADRVGAPPIETLTLPSAAEQNGRTVPTGGVRFGSSST
jgi:hypothetical protein